MSEESLANNKRMTMYIIVNQSLNMPSGKMASQVAHVVQMVTHHIVTEIYENMSLPKYCLDYEKWRENPITVVLGSKGHNFDKLLKLENATYFVDKGRTTQNTSDQITAIAFYPCDTLDNFFASYDLLD